MPAPRQAQEAATQGTPISPSVFIWEVVRWEIPEAALRLHRVNVVLPLQGCANRYMCFRTIVLTTCEIADQVRNDGEALKAFKSVKAR